MLSHLGLDISLFDRFDRVNLTVLPDVLGKGCFFV